MSLSSLQSILSSGRAKLNANSKWILGIFYGCGIPIVMFCFFLHIWEDRHDSALLGAIVHHNVPAARQAFQDGATMQMEMRRHWTFLQAAAFQGDVGMAKLLVEHGAADTAWAANDERKTAYDIALAKIGRASCRE